MRKEEIIRENREKTSKLPLLVSLGLLAVLAGCYFLIPSFHAYVHEAFEVLTSDDRQRIRAWVAQYEPVGPLILILAMVVQMFLFVVPNVLLMMIAIVSYGPIWGALISLTGVFVSSTTGYFIGRRLGPVTLNKLISVKTQQKISEFIEDYGVGAIAITRLSSLSNDSLSFVAGLLRMSYRKYILATLAGITPLVVVLALYGHGGRIERGLIWVAGVSLVGLIIYIIVDKRRKKNRARKRARERVEA